MSSVLPVDTLLPVPPVAPFAGFWRRVAAFLVDGLALSLIGYALATVLADAFVQLGAWGRCVGFLVALAYFVPQESADGQSIGKRLLGIRVVDAQGRALSPARSVVRFVVFGVPYFLNGALLPMTAVMFAGGFPVAVLALGGMLALAYLLVFNRRTRQSLHDLAVGAFVVRVSEGGGARHAPGPARMWGGHRAIAGVLVVLAGATPLLFPTLMHFPVFADLRVLYDRLAQERDLRTVNVFETTTRVYGTQATSQVRELLIKATIDKPLADSLPLSTRLAGIALKVFPNAAHEDRIIVRLAHGYDIGIASSWTFNDLEFTPGQWADRVAAGIGN